MPFRKHNYNRKYLTNTINISRISQTHFCEEIRPFSYKTGNFWIEMGGISRLKSEKFQNFHFQA